MILFLLKKNFCDGWDNLLSLFVYNCISLALIAGGAFSNEVAAAHRTCNWNNFFAYFND